MVSIIESKVIEELKKSYDPILMNEQEIYDDYNRIANSVGIEIEDVERICKDWQFDKIREDMKAVEEKESRIVHQEDDGFCD